jgi:hypothetical protein
MKKEWKKTAPKTNPPPTSNAKSHYLTKIELFSA